MSFRKVCYVLGSLLGIIALLTFAFRIPKYWNHLMANDGGLLVSSDVSASSEKQHNIGSGQRKSLHKKKEILISETERMELAHKAIVNIQWPSQANIAETKLREEIKFIYLFPPSQERNFWLSFLGESYAKSALESSLSNEELLNRLQRFGSIVKEGVNDSDLERILISASKQCAEMIRKLPNEKSDELYSYLASHESTDDVQMATRISASYHVDELTSTENPDSSLIDNIKNEEIRMLAEQTFLKTYDFGYASEKVVETFAARYLDPNSGVKSDHQIAIRLFGVGLKKYPEAISTIILNAPPGQKKDEAIEQMIYRIAPDDNERARLWWDQIQDPKIKQRAEIDISGKRERADPSREKLVVDPSKSPFK